MAPASPTSSSNTTTTIPVSYKDNLLTRLGGPRQYEVTILVLCDRLKSDRTLKRFYGDFDGDCLTLLLRETMDLAFVDFPTPEARDKAETRVRLHHFRLIENGLSVTHFRLFRENLVAALRESWAEEELIEIIKNHLKFIRNVFESVDIYQPEEMNWDDSITSVDEEEEEDGASVALASVPTLPDVRAVKAVRRRRSSTDKLAAMFQSLAKKANLTSC